MDRLAFWEKTSVLTEGCSCAVGYHESRVQTTFSHQEGRQLAEGVVAEPFDSSFANRGKFMDTNGQIVQGLKEFLNSVGLYWNMLSGSGAILKAYFGWVFTMEVSSRNSLSPVGKNHLSK